MIILVITQLEQYNLIALSAQKLRFLLKFFLNNDSLHLLLSILLLVTFSLVHLDCNRIDNLC
jgi:hypothetical protein